LLILLGKSHYLLLTINRLSCIYYERFCFKGEDLE